MAAGTMQRSMPCRRYDIYGNSQLDAFNKEGRLRFIDVDLEPGRRGRRKLRSAKAKDASTEETDLRKHAKSTTQLEAYGKELADRIARLTPATYNDADAEWEAAAAVRKEEDQSAALWSDVCMYCLRGEQGSDGELMCCEHSDRCCNVAHLGCTGLAEMPEKWECTECVPCAAASGAQRIRADGC